MSGSVWRFAGFEYSPQSGLRRDGRQIHLGPQARQLLELLLESKGGVVSKAEIASRLWPSRPPSDDSIDRCAYLLRKPLRDAGYGDLIATAYGRGLSLRSAIELSEPSADASRIAETMIDGRTLDLWQTVYELAAKQTRDGYERAQSAVAAAGELNPSSPAIWSLSANIAAGRVIRGHLSPMRAAEMIERDACRALSLAPDFTSALAVLGWARALLLAKPDEGLSMLDRAVAQDPHFSKARAYRSWALLKLDRLQEAVADVEAGLCASPHFQGLLAQRAWLALCAGEVSGAIEMARRGLGLRPDSGWLRGVDAIACSLSGRHGEAEAAARRGLETAPEDPSLLAVLSYVLAADGRAEEAEQALAAAPGDGEVCAPRLFKAAAQLAMSRADDALLSLQGARDECCPWFVFARYDPRLVPLRADIDRLQPPAPDC
ncbi:winged helix-turn-helix domain-containing protein [Methylocystis parvus]|uniref:Transcriptional regulator n=1 Tax=Methylocystis parvus TaxID=134 RepID=A0A6B8M727_9HYPH|nr:winged helix-turn-helix domain-containing protein [Methylocystis parvus]QGM97812.1 transcriptional regulator [Methylocystis parvus]WBK01878.1 winged helix-turn-helix domain-containing protein [Methylocystis parvus OBBP]